MRMQAHAAYRTMDPATGAPRTREQGIMAELPQVYSIAARIRERLPASVQLEDLVSAGVTGLIEAYDSYDSTRDAQFKTFARLRIRGAILDSLRSLDWGSRSLRRRAREIAEVSTRLEAALGRKAEDTEIAAEMKITLEQLETARTQIDGLQIVGQSAASSADPDESFDLIENAPSRDENPFQMCLRSEQKRHLATAIGQLKEREQLVLSLYYKEELTMKEVAEVIGIALSRVSQIHQAALVKLRSSLAELEKRPAQAGMQPHYRQTGRSASAAMAAGMATL